MKHLTILCIILMGVGSAKAQVRKKDTAACIMIVCDTLHYSNYTPQLNSSNYFDRAGNLTWVSGYIIREQHNKREEVLDPGMCMGCHYYDYWEGTGVYLDSNKKILSKYIMVLQSFVTAK